MCPVRDKLVYQQEKMHPLRKKKGLQGKEVKYSGERQPVGKNLTHPGEKLIYL